MTKLFFEWPENYFAPETRVHCILVGLDTKCKIVWLLDIHFSNQHTDLTVTDNVQGMYLPTNYIHLQLFSCGYMTLHNT